MKRLLLPALAIGVVLAGTSQAQAATIVPPPIVLDTFDTDGPLIDKSAGTTIGTFSAVKAGPGILGGERKVDFKITTHPNNRTAIAGVTEGQFILDTGPSVLTSASITWDGIGTAGLSNNPSLGVDLTQQGAFEVFKLGIVDVDQYTNLKFTVIDKSGRTSTLTKNNLEAGPVNFNFADFLGTADFTNAYSVQLGVTSPRAIDLQIDFLEATVVPEPFTILGSVAALGFGTAFRRKYKKKA
jgi:hypothetical protein